MKNYVFTESYLNLLYEVYDKDSEYFKKLLNFILQKEHLEFSKRTTGRGGHRHHIIPQFYYKSRNIKVDNSEQNIIMLSFYEHILIHYYSLCCCKIYKPKFASSLNLICKNFIKDFNKSIIINENWIIKNKSEIEEIESYMNSDEFSKVRGSNAKGHVVSDKLRKQYSEFFKGKSFATEEGRRKMSEASKNRIITDEARLHYSQSAKGRVMSEHTRKLISEHNRKYTNEQVVIIKNCMRNGMKRMDIVRNISEVKNLSRNTIYRIMKKIENNEL